MTERAAVMGAGGHSRVVSSILKANHTDIKGFFDDSYCGVSEDIQGAPLLGRFEDILNYKDAIQLVYLSLGNNFIRKKHFDFIYQNRFCMPSLLHPTAIIESDVNIGSATTICLGAIIGTEVRIGKGCILNTGCAVDHESKIGDFVHLAPRVTIAGRSSVGDCTFVGMNSTIAEKVMIGKNVVIGAGSVILRDVPDEATVVGIHR